MRISKDRARDAAARLTEKAEKNVEALKKEYVVLVTEYYNASIPAEVHAFAKKYAKHISFASGININGHGFNREVVYVDQPYVISNVEGYAQANLELSSKAADVVKKAKNKWLDAQKEYKALREETRIALLNLGTTTKIAQQLPIAAQFLHGCDLPAKYPVPAVNLAPLKAKLQKLQKA